MPKIICYFCGDQSPTEELLACLMRCRQAGQLIRIIGDLPGLVADHPESLSKTLAKASVVFAPYAPRAIQALLDYANISIPDKMVLVDSRRPKTWPALSESQESGDDTPPPDSQLDALRSEIEQQSRPADAWRPWYPVIDRQLCIDCKQCAKFCLFGVYDVSAEGKVSVANPQKCKNNCPACARLCPKQAIIFPKYPDAPINGYPADETTETQPAPLDVAKLVDGDVLAKLRQRQAEGTLPANMPEMLNSLAPKAKPCNCSHDGRQQNDATSQESDQ